VGSICSVILSGLGRKPLDYFLQEEHVLLFDPRQRVGEEPLMLTLYSHSFHAVAAFNPAVPRLGVTPSQKNAIGLWDVR